METLVAGPCASDCGARSSLGRQGPPGVRSSQGRHFKGNRGDGNGELGGARPRLYDPA